MAILATYEKLGLEPTSKPKGEFEKEYNQIRNRLIDSKKFSSTDRNLNKTILTEMGEYPNWKGEVYKMSQGVARPESKRDASNLKSNIKRNKILIEADELMTAAGHGKEVKLGKRNFKNQDRSGGMALDHEYETQEFGDDYKRLKQKFAAGVITETQFKTELNKIVSKKPGNIKSNLTLKTEKENYAKMDKTRRTIKDKNLAEQYKVRDASYTSKMNSFLKSVNQTKKLSGIHAFAKQFLTAQTQGYDATLVTNGETNGHTNGHTNGKTNGHTNGKTNGKTNGHKNGDKKIVLNGNKTNNYRGLSTLMEQPNTWSDPLLMTPVFRTLDKSIDVSL